ncbi:MBL fold metallo-hydrolase [Streptomyces hainanensis]|uniref:MBL fold metallo-hydrolase n=1 Tax=Streptomyces hainanensis TaxID=402648 RepID=A0A4R4TTZ1_9ACTN|nr:MBL fold metallo-hydrolase [Streptomyces hainanensis]TDC80266.1 MBL fold metallo-hydrolase [Streptomyces hainanensis]
MRPRVRQVASDTFLVSGSDTNWVIVRDGDTATLIDSGYPADRDAVLASLAAVAVAPEAVAALLLTHAHADHLGAAQSLRTRYGTPVLAHPEEVPHARRDFLDQVSLGQVAARAWRPGVASWAVRALRAGATADVAVAEPRPFPAPGRLDLPGAPLPVHTPGHTRGHCCYLLPDRGVLVGGDALVTAHPTSRVAGPQLLPAMFHADRARALRSLTALETLPAELLLPGHGPALRTDVRTAVARARESATRTGYSG